MVRKGWVGCAIPKDLADLIDEFIKNNPKYGYKSRNEFIVEAVRKRLQELGYLK